MEAQLVQILQLLQQTQQQAIQQQQQEAEANRAMQANLVQALGDTQRQLAAAVQAMTESKRSSGSVVDVTKVGKPELPKGQTKTELQKAWTDWSYVFRTWFCSQFRHAEHILKWAQDRYDTRIDNLSLEEAVEKNPTWREVILDVSKQLDVALSSMCRDGALSIVKNALKGESKGLDAWRRLCKEYDPINAMSNRRLLRKIVQPQQQSLDNLRQAIEEWENDLREYTERAGRDLEDEQKQIGIQDLCPDSLRNHLELQAGRLKTYELTRKEVDAYLESRSSREVGGASPMEVDTLVNGYGGKSTWKGGPKGNHDQPYKGKGYPTGQWTKRCQHCGGRLTNNHTEWKCWFNPRNNSPEAVQKRKEAAERDRKGQKGGPPEGKGKGGKRILGLKEQTWPEEPEPIHMLFKSNGIYGIFENDGPFMPAAPNQKGEDSDFLVAFNEEEEEDHEEKEPSGKTLDAYEDEYKVLSPIGEDEYGFNLDSDSNSKFFSSALSGIAGRNILEAIDISGALMLSSDLPNTLSFVTFTMLLRK